MEYYTSGDYDYFNNIIENPKRHHIGFIFNQIHDMYITSPLNIMKETFVSFPNLFVKEMLKPWMNTNIKKILSYQNSMYGTNIINK